MHTSTITEAGFNFERVVNRVKSSGEMGCVTPMLFVLCVCGTLLSSYAVYIERSKEADNSYKAHCDLDETIACSHVLTSE